MKELTKQQILKLRENMVYHRGVGIKCGMNDCPVYSVSYVNPDPNGKNVVAFPLSSFPEAESLGIEFPHLEIIRYSLVWLRLKIERHLSSLKREIVLRKLDQQFKKVNNTPAHTFNPGGKKQVFPKFDPIASIVMAEVFIGSKSMEEYNEYKEGDLSKDPTSETAWSITFKELGEPAKMMIQPFVDRNGEVVYYDKEGIDPWEEIEGQGNVPDLMDQVDFLGDMFEKMKGMNT